MIPLGRGPGARARACVRRARRSTRPIDQALGCVVAAPVVATEPVPPFVNSSRDGYALRAADTADAAGRPVRCVSRSSDRSWPAPCSTRPIGPGQAVRIMTGAPLPAGADAVCMLEDCSDEDGGAVRGHRPSGRPGRGRPPGRRGRARRRRGGRGGHGAHARPPRGAGQPRARPGSVHPRPRVGVLSTGDELVTGPGPLGPGQIRDANRHTLLALVAARVGTRSTSGSSATTRRRSASAFDRAADGCDAIVTSGGVSVGDLDIVKVVLEKRCGGHDAVDAGGDPTGQAVRLRHPRGGPARRSSGYPAIRCRPWSASSSSSGPASAAWPATASLDQPVVPAVAETDSPASADGKTHFVRAAVSAGRGRTSGECDPMVGQDSHQLLAMAEANALAVLPDGEGVAAGGTVDVHPHRSRAGSVAEPIRQAVRPW